MFRRTIAPLAVLALALPAFAADRDNKLPDDAKAILEGADTFEVYSLDPKRSVEKPKDHFHGWKVLGKTALKDRKERAKLLGALQKGIKESDGSAALCFNPRHGIRAVKGDKSVDLVICYECLSMQVWQGDKAGSVLTTRSPEKAFNRLLAAAKVPLPTQRDK
jgi:hypothetical protein